MWYMPDYVVLNPTKCFLRPTASFRNKTIRAYLITLIILFIEGSLLSAKVLFCLRALFGATQIHSYTRMGYLIRTRLSDLCSHFWALLGTTVPQDENLPTCAPSGLEPSTYHILGRQH